MNVNFAGINFRSTEPEAAVKAFEAKYLQPMHYSCTSGTFLNVLSLPDGCGYTHPDDRCFEKKKGKLYFEDGSVCDVEDGRERFGFVDKDGVKYSEWTDAQRKEVRARFKAERQKEAAEEKERQEAWQRDLDERAVLVKSAKKKLTAKEWAAVEEHWASEYYS